MRCRQVVLGAVVAVLGMSGSGLAEDDPTIGEAMRLIRKGDDFYKGLFIGAARGIEASNFYLGENGQLRLYCPPDAMDSMPFQQWVSIVERYLEDYPRTVSRADTSLPLVMARAIKDVFPCR